MHPVDGTSSSATVVRLQLNPAVVVEKGWGRAKSNLSSIVSYAATGATVPSASEDDWNLEASGATSVTSTSAVRNAHHDAGVQIAHLHSSHGHRDGDGDGGGDGDGQAAGGRQLLGGCGFAPSKDPSFVGDLRSGDPGEVTTALLGHPVWGAASASATSAHSIVGLRLSFQYVAGYTPPAGVSRKGSTVSVVLIDVANRSDVATLFTSEPLTNYSFDQYTGYSPPIDVRVKGVHVPNGRALYVALRCSHSPRGWVATGLCAHPPIPCPPQVSLQVCRRVTPSCPACPAHTTLAKDRLLVSLSALVLHAPRWQVP